MKIGDIVLIIRYYETDFNVCLSYGLNPVIIGKIASITDDSIFADVVCNNESHFCYVSELILLKEL